MDAALELAAAAAKFLWKHRALAVIAVLAILLGLTKWRLDVVSKDRDMYKVEAVVATGNLNEARKALDIANGEVEKARADETRTEAIHAAHEAEQAKMLSKAEQTIQEWYQRANEHPETVQPLGSAACDAYRSLYGERACPGSSNR